MAGAKQARSRNRSGAGKSAVASNGAKAKDSAASRNGPDRAGSGRGGTAASTRPAAKPGQTRRARDRAQARQLARQLAVAEPKPAAGPPLWLQLTTLVLSVAGLGVSIYLTVAHYTSSSILACSDTGLINCSAVTTSPQSMVFGVFPVAVLGLAFFVFMVPVNTPWAWRSPRREIALARLVSVIVGVGFILYLIYVELLQVKAICLWCTSVHVMTFLLFVLVTFSAAIYGLPKASGRVR
jgi:uncharacterized membrane protein